MKIIHLDLGMGAAGDMLMAALYELLPEDGRESFIEKMNSLGLCGVRVNAQKCNRCGITGTHMEVTVDGISENEHEQDHDHDHHHDHHHHHTGMDDIQNIIEGMNVSGSVKSNVLGVYGIIAEAESRAHDTEVSLVHFHEVGAMDAIADITGVCLLMDILSPDEVTSTPVCTGYGKVKCAHGMLPVPAPATANILTGIPVYASDIEGELCTPTGAALVSFFTDRFCNMPVIRPERFGYGMGKREYECLNCVRAIIGESDEVRERVSELSCNVDDMTGEAVGYATRKLLESGARDVYTIPLGMKKSRPGVMINVICDTADEERFAELIFKFTTTIGIRVRECRRYTLEKRCRYVRTPSGNIGVKISEGYGIRRIKPEYEQLARIAEECGISIDEASDMIIREINEEQI